MKTTTIIGALFILLGILFLGPAVGLFTLKLMWPSILFLVGAGLLVTFFAARKLYGLLMPGAVLTISSIPLFICTFSDNWHQMSSLWPIFLFAVSAGFFLMFFFGKKEVGLLVSALILLSLGAISFLIFNYIQYVFPIAFLVTGLVLIFIGLSSKKKAKNEKLENTSIPDEV